VALFSAIKCVPKLSGTVARAQVQKAKVVLICVNEMEADKQKAAMYRCCIRIGENR
jgi:hypothetical protein